MPIDINVLGKEGREIYREWKKKVSHHNRNKQAYHKGKKMHLWQKDLNEINSHYRKILKSIEAKKKKEIKELEKALLYAEKVEEEAKKKAAVERAAKRKLNKETRKAVLAKVVPRKSRRLAEKNEKLSTSVCSGKSISNPNMCEKNSSCKVAKGTKRSFCRTKHNKTLKKK